MSLASIPLQNTSCVRYNNSLYAYNMHVVIKTVNFSSKSNSTIIRGGVSNLISSLQAANQGQKIIQVVAKLGSVRRKQTHQTHRTVSLYLVKSNKEFKPKSYTFYYCYVLITIFSTQ